jgi:branched-chain amino acid transport system ATP-binding protein
MSEVPSAGGSLLTVRDIKAWYGDSQALHGVSFSVKKGELVTLVGRNGAGKSTILRSIMGLLERRSGSIRFEGHELIALTPELIARHGIGYCPEERGIFATLNVVENLMMPPQLRPGGMSVEQIYTLFPNLAERKRSPGTKLSGGEQQMLAIARILRTGSTLLLLDEPTEGLAPVIVKQIGRVIRDLKQRGFTILLVEQNFRFASSLADRHYVVENGRIVEEVVRSQMAEAATIARLQAQIGV